MELMVDKHITRVFMCGAYDTDSVVCAHIMAGV